MKYLLAMLALLAIGSTATANDFATLNTSEWRMAQVLVEKTEATRIECPSSAGNAACFRWPMFLTTARGSIDDYLLDESPGRQFVEVVGDWEQVGENEIVRRYEHYGDPLVVYFNGTVLILVKE